MAPDFLTFQYLAREIDRTSLVTFLGHDRKSIIASSLPETGETVRSHVVVLVDDTDPGIRSLQCVGDVVEAESMRSSDMMWAPPKT